MNNKPYVIKETGYLDLGLDKIKSLLSTCPDYFTPCYRNGIFQVQAKHYVGTIVYGDGTVVEILPKLDSPLKETKELLERMIRTVYLRPHSLEKSVSSTIKDSLLEYYIRMFCWEAEELFRKGISHGYSRREENLSCVKGRIVFNKDIRNNIVDRSKIYVNHEIYSDDRPENRIILATANLLQNVTHDSDNKRLLSLIQLSFKDVAVINDYKREFRKCTNDRSVQHYDKILDICDVFLNGSHSVYSGNHVSISLLFDMNALYERYVAHWIRVNYPDAVVKTQDSTKKLFGQFGIRPDIVMDYCGKTYILDTKWKILEKYGDVKMDDIQQMHSYISEYGTDEAYLLYPENNLSDKEYPGDKGILHLSFVNLFDEKSIRPVRLK